MSSGHATYKYLNNLSNIFVILREEKKINYCVDHWSYFIERVNFAKHNEWACTLETNCYFFLRERNFRSPIIRTLVHNRIICSLLQYNVTQYPRVKSLVMIPWIGLRDPSSDFSPGISRSSLVSLSRLLTRSTRATRRDVAWRGADNMADNRGSLDPVTGFVTQC